MDIQNSFGFLINVCAKRMKRELDSRTRESGITNPQWSELKLLATKNDLTQAEIAKRLYSDFATVGSVTDRLAQKRFLQKTRTKEDRRAFRIHITQKGLAVVKAVERKAIECNQNALAGFSNDETGEFLSYLNRVISNLSGGER